MYKWYVMFEMIRKTGYTYIQGNISHKKEWNNAIGSNKNGTRDYHTKWSESDRGDIF